MSDDRERQIVDEFKAAMLDAIEEFFEKHLRPPGVKGSPDRRLQLATAVLLIEVSRADLEIKEEERRAVTDAVQRSMFLTSEQTAEIVSLAEKQVERSVPLHLFARLIDKEFSLDQKRVIVEQMWRVAFSDAQILAHEEYLVRKVSQLLHLPLADFLEAKIRARDSFQ